MEKSLNPKEVLRQYLRRPEIQGALRERGVSGLFDDQVYALDHLPIPPEVREARDRYLLVLELESLRLQSYLPG